MSTPTRPMPPHPKPFYLTNLITIFGLVFGIAFGICSVSGISLSRGGNVHSAHLLILTAVIMGAICLLCLLAVVIFAIIHSRWR